MLESERFFAVLVWLTFPCCLGKLVTHVDACQEVLYQEVLLNNEELIDQFFQCALTFT